MGRNMWEQIVGKGVEIRAIATGRRNRHSYTPIEAEFVQVFRTDMLPFTGEYTKKLKRPQKTAIVQELGKAEEEARRLKADGSSAEQILKELKVHYSAEAIRERLNLPPFEEHSAQPHSPAAEPSDGLHLYERTGETPGPTDLIDPHDLVSGGGQDSLTKQQRRRGEVPGYGESWTARKAAIYGRSL